MLNMQCITWNPVDFMKSTGFHLVHPYHWMLNIQCISVFELDAKYAVYFMKSSGFHGWNLADFMKSSRFHGWNPADFMSDLEKCKLENVKFLSHL